MRITIFFENIGILCIFCGDIYGYFYSGTQILKILKDKCAHLIRGNHDDYLLKLSKNGVDANFFEKYGYAHKLALKDLSRDDLSFIRRLPINVELSIDGISISISHGMPHNNSIYFMKTLKIGKWKCCLLITLTFM